MHIGLDFDNTIVSYDALFHKVALEGGWITGEVPVSKVSVRNHLRAIGQEPTWTEMQGYVYGARMDEAAAYPGVVDCLAWAREQGIPVSIVSHKTRHPFLGKQYDLHAAARHWINIHLTDAVGPLVAQERVYFELTKESKVQHIADIGCTVYVDDLPEILLAPGFPTDTDPILFDPDNHHIAQGLPRALNWAEVRKTLVSQWKQTV
jgi:FMN phosphatase YigB (HAD superfamily)